MQDSISPRGVKMENITMLYVGLSVIEAFPIIFMFAKALNILLDKIEKKYDSILDRCAVDSDYKNNVASLIFFFQDMGPNISSFSVISLFITDKENYTVLIIIFFVGIIMKEKSRKFKKVFYQEIEKRS